MQKKDSRDGRRRRRRIKREEDSFTEALIIIEDENSFNKGVLLQLQFHQSFGSKQAPAKEQTRHQARGLIRIPVI